MQKVYAAPEKCAKPTEAMDSAIENRDPVIQETKGKTKPRTKERLDRVYPAKLSEGYKFGIKVVKASFEINNPHFAPVQIANYEQIENIDCSIYGCVVLDESSILKNFTGKYKNLIIDTFKNTPYKLACTATPSPNDLNEIGNHSEFLDVLDSQDMRSKWFVRDEGMNNYRLKQHAKKDFYGWISSWATMITNPKDLGFSGDEYVLPKLNQIEHEIVTAVS